MKIGDRTQRCTKAGKDVCAWCLESINSEDESCNYCLHHFVIQALHAYGSAIDDDENVGQKLLPTDKHPADDWAILAVMCLLKLAGCRVWTRGQDQSLFQKKDVQHMLQAVVILEYAYSKSKANPQISLLLVRLYSYLGAGSLALRAYLRLGIKQIQGDTLGFVLFDRISSLHPHPTTDDASGTAEDLDPTFYLKKLQRLYRGFKTQISTNSWRSFENGSYDSVFELMEVSDALSRSITLAMSVIESRKIDRLTNLNYAMSKDSHGFDILRKLLPWRVDYCT
jgi:N-terminal acetyltransferase B complex non-catalytic subunit